MTGKQGNKCTKLTFNFHSKDRGISFYMFSVFANSKAKVLTAGQLGLDNF